jgi:hypothetical protein
VPLYLLGRQMDEMVPLGFLAEGHSVFFAIMSYNGKLDISMLADREALEDIDQLAEGLREAVDELKAAAGLGGGDGPKRGRARRRTRGDEPKRFERAKATTGANGRAG